MVMKWWGEGVEMMKWRWCLDDEKGNWKEKQVSLGHVCVQAISMKRWNCQISKSMVFKYLEKGFPWKLEIHVWCKFLFFVELVLMLFDAAADSLLKTSIKEGSDEMI